MNCVLGQSAVASGRAALTYVIADGASTDGTAELARQVGEDRVTVDSRPDTGMYDALARQWEQLGPVDVVAYLNAGDVWQATALDVVLDVMEARDAKWVCGRRVLYDADGRVLMNELPPRFRRELIAAGCYGGLLPHIQQESTFWAGSLMTAVDLDRLKALRLAGDQYLWSCFAKEGYEPHVVDEVLGGHRLHDNQLSADAAGYRAEAQTVTRAPTRRESLQAVSERVVWRLPTWAKQRLNPTHLLRRDHATGAWK